MGNLTKVSMKVLLALIAAITQTTAKNIYEVASSFAESSVESMMENIRRDGDDAKTWIMTYGDSITDGFGASDMLKTGYVNLLKEGFKMVHPTFDVV